MFDCVFKPQLLIFHLDTHKMMKMTHDLEYD